MTGVPFWMPYIAGMRFDTGPQPFNPGESVQPWAGHMGGQFSLMPWPGAVPVINALANFAGVPRDRAPVPVVNRVALLPSENLFIAGFVGKSKG